MISLFRIFALCQALTFCVPLGQAEKLPIETFFKAPEFRRMRLSPDGKWLAAIAPQEGKNNLVTIRLSDRKTFGCTRETENEVTSFMWVSNTRLIFEMKNKNNFPNGGLYAVNRDGTKPKVLNPSTKTHFEFGSRVVKFMNLFDPLTDEGEDILVEARRSGTQFREDKAFYAHVVRLNTLTGKQKREVYNRGDIIGFIMDREKVVRVAVTQHGLMRSILHRRSHKDEWEEVYKGDFRSAV